MAKKIDTDANINSIRFSQQISHPSSPASGYEQLYIVSGSPHGGLYVKDSSGRQIGPFITGTTTSQSSASMSILDLNKDLSAGTYNQSKLEYEAIGANATGTLVNYAGGNPGLVTRLQVIVGGNTTNIRESKIRIYYDGETTPSVDAPLDMFFASEYAGDNSFSSFISDYISMSSNYGGTGVGYVLNLPIPFNTGIKIQFANGGGACTIWTEVVYYTGILNTWSDGRKLLVNTNTLTNQTVNTVISFLNVSGTNPGRLAGIYSSIDSAPNTANPATAPMEGNFKIYTDGSVTPNYESTGYEDFYNGSFYFVGKANSGNEYTASVSRHVGITYKSANTWNGYRFFIPDPLYFNTSLRVTWNCGDSSQVNFTGGVRVAWCVWYYVT